PEDVIGVGANAKMNEFQALMGVMNLRYIDHEIALRKAAVQTYRDRLTMVPGICCMKDMPGIKHNYAYFPILIDEAAYGLSRDELFGLLEKHDIHPRKYFYPLVTEYQCYRKLFSNEDLPVANYVAKRIMTLPLWGEIPLDTVEKICSIIQEGHKNA
ncbi:MAG: DegT/DnrJ/EryC1/StrS family aminotransferase, partial [Anaerolineaceae bacterium]|nr:DegT/DnrJ/EryC1/StrS family aminotransferase [Anaerolineaceae bacterium]